MKRIGAPTRDRQRATSSGGIRESVVPPASARRRRLDHRTVGDRIGEAGTPSSRDVGAGPGPATREAPRSPADRDRPPSERHERRTALGGTQRSKVAATAHAPPPRAPGAAVKASTGLEVLVAAAVREVHQQQVPPRQARRALDRPGDGVRASSAGRDTPRAARHGGTPPPLPRPRRSRTRPGQDRAARRARDRPLRAVCSRRDRGSA